MLMSTIVVGVDGSEHSIAALQWAAEEARLRGASLHLVTAWEFPYVANPAVLLTLESEPFADEARHTLDRALDAIDADGIDVSTAVIEGSAAQHLVERSRTADLVVVGSRGRGGFTGLLLGSVSQHLVSYAKCPVLVHYVKAEHHRT
jgi:nucleotide-binding universal stress UspA family protein